MESLPGFIQDTDVTGFYIAGRLEFYLGDNTMAGVSGYYNALEADTPLGQDVDSNTYAVSLYLRHRLECQFRDRRSRPKLGIGAQFGERPVQFGVGFDTTIGRNTANAQVFRASATYRF